MDSSSLQTRHYKIPSNRCPSRPSTEITNPVTECELNLENIYNELDDLDVYLDPLSVSPIETVRMEILTENSIPKDCNLNMPLEQIVKPKSVDTYKFTFLSIVFIFCCILVLLLLLLALLLFFVLLGISRKIKIMFIFFIILTI